MFDMFSALRFSHSATALLAVALVAFTGCRVLSPKSSPPTPLAPPSVTPPIHQPTTDESDPYVAFRPIMREEQFSAPIPAQKPSESTLLPESKQPKNEPNPEIVAAQSKVDELNRRISELETQLEVARQAPPPIVVPEPQPQTKTVVRPARSLPTISRQGVKVYADEMQNVRIEITDDALFMPNCWQLTASGEETLRVIAAELGAFDPKLVLDIEGHTDSLVGDPNNPMQKHDISTVKTKVVMDFFVSALRWDASRIGTSSFGRNRPIADNETPEGRAQNNRIEIVLRDGEQ